MKKRSIFTLALAAGLMASCGSTDQNQAQSGTDSTAVTGTDLITLTGAAERSLYLSIVDQSEQDTSFTYRVSAVHDGDTIGFNVSMAKDIQPGVNNDGSVNEENGFKTGTVQFHRSGAESDRFIQHLAQHWGITLENASFSNDPVVPLTFSSNKEGVDHSTPATHSFKLFFNPDAREPGELFFTHDTYLRRVELQEKDSTYRREILRALTGASEL